MELAEWIVVSRPGFSLPKSSLPERVHVLNGVHEDVSATLLRERLRLGESCGDLVPTRVLRYIREHHLVLDLSFRACLLELSFRAWSRIWWAMNSW